MLVASAESTSKLVCQAISLGGGLPAYVGEKQVADVRADEAVLGLLLESRGDGKRMAYLSAGSAVGRSAAVDAGILRASAVRWDLRDGWRADPGARGWPQRPLDGPLGNLRSGRQPRASCKTELAAQGLFAHQQYQPILDKDRPRVEKFGKRAGKLRRTDGNSGCAKRSRLSPFDRR